MPSEVFVGTLRLDGIVAVDWYCGGALIALWQSGALIADTVCSSVIPYLDLASYYIDDEALLNPITPHQHGILSKEVFEPSTCEAAKLPITDANHLDVLGGSYCHEGTMESSASGFATNSLEALPTEGPGVIDDIKKQSGILLSQAEYKTFPICITLSNVPVEFWTPLGLSWIAGCPTSFRPSAALTLALDAVPWLTGPVFHAVGLSLISVYS
ncbi:hypothetical protein Nepgr_033835 [Nepenthes gracilis]|uniref:Uncharacterized protein n=1 Tax=Nepenthes gracilis TaxID=150966 RepID=A0AAD3TMK1_NEPGR|nr:hypothetical protein Nepgr_033835 [Nepenthes gracilis]